MNLVKAGESLRDKVLGKTFSLKAKTIHIQDARMS